MPPGRSGLIAMSAAIASNAAILTSQGSNQASLIEQASARLQVGPGAEAKSYMRTRRRYRQLFLAMAPWSQGLAQRQTFAPMTQAAKGRNERFAAPLCLAPIGTKHADRLDGSF